MVSNVLHLPDFSLMTVDLLLDLLYTGRAESQGGLDPDSGDLLLVQLYHALGLDTGEAGGLPDITELEFIRRPGDLTGGAGAASIGVVVDICQEEDETSSGDHQELSGHSPPNEIENIEFEEPDGNGLNKAEDLEVDELLKDDDSGEESESFNCQSNGSPNTGQATYSTPCLSPLDLSNKSVDIEMVETETKEDEGQSNAPISDTSFLDAVNQDFTEVSNDSTYENSVLHDQIDNIIDKQSTQFQSKIILNKLCKKVQNENKYQTIPRLFENGIMLEYENEEENDQIREMCHENEEENDQIREMCQENQRKRNRRKSSPKVRKRQKLPQELDSNSLQPNTKQAVETDEKFNCPLKECNFYHRGQKKSASSHPLVYYILKHFISEHLGQSPCKLYDFKRINMKMLECPHCTYKNESKKSIFAHMAFEHQNLQERILKNAKQIQNDKPAVKIIEQINKYLTLSWDKWTSCETILTNIKESNPALYLNDLTVDAPEPVSEECVFTENTVIPLEVYDETENEKHIILKHPAAVEEPKISAVSEVNNQRDIFCKVCFNYKFKDINGLREHIVEQHKQEYGEVPLLEAGEKYYECELCTVFKRSKSKLVFMKHIKKVHGQIYLELITSDEAWAERVLCKEDFCSQGPEMHQMKVVVPADLSILHDCNPLSSRLSSSSQPPVPVLRENPLFSPGDSDRDEGGEDSPFQSYSDDNVSIIEDFAFINRTPEELRIKSLDRETSCKVCDLEFDHSRDVSKHVFLAHIEHHEEITKKVWRCLYSQEESTFVCTICGCMKDTEQIAKLHVYNKHKRDLKKMMDKKKIDWKNLLDYIGYNIPENQIKEYESDFELEDSFLADNTQIIEQVACEPTPSTSTKNDSGTSLKN